jgi:hypothetical protein
VPSLLGIIWILLEVGWSFLGIVSRRWPKRPEGAPVLAVVHRKIVKGNVYVRRGNLGLGMGPGIA